MKTPKERAPQTPISHTANGPNPDGNSLPPNYPRELSEIFTLKDGSILKIRPIHPDDMERLQYASTYCPPETLFRRFNTPMDELSDEYSHFLTHVDYQNHLALVAIDPAADMIIAVARYFVPAHEELGEVAVIVGDPYPGQGLASTLLKSLLNAAKSRGIKGFEAYIPLDNDPAGGLARCVAEKTDFVLHSEIDSGTRHLWLKFDETS